MLIVVSPSDHLPLVWYDKCRVSRDGARLIGTNALRMAWMIVIHRVDMLEYHRSIPGVASVVCRAAASGIPDDRELTGGRLKMMISHSWKPQ